MTGLTRQYPFNFPSLCSADIASLALCWLSPLWTLDSDSHLGRSAQCEPTLNILLSLHLLSYNKLKWSKINSNNSVTFWMFLIIYYYYLDHFSLTRPNCKPSVCCPISRPCHHMFRMVSVFLFAMPLAVQVNYIAVFMLSPWDTVREPQQFYSTCP